MSDQNERDALKPSGQLEDERATSTLPQDPLEILRPRHEGLIAEMQTARSKEAVKALFPLLAPKART